MYQMNGKKVCSLLLAVALTSSVLVGCGKSETKKETKTPVDDGKPKSFSLLVPLNQNFPPANVSDLSTVYCLQELEKRTNTKVTYSTIPFGTEGDQANKFNIMIASGDVPDAIFWSNNGSEMGKLTSNQVIIKLNELVDKYGPNIKKEFDTVPDLRRQTLDDNSDLWDIPGYITDLELRGGSFSRAVIRKDWLNKLNLNEPETQDDWYKVLKAFKEKDPNGNGKQDEIPFSAVAGAYDNDELAFLLFWPYGIKAGFYNDNGVAKFGALQPEFKKGLEFGRKLFAEGLVDPDSLNQNLAQVDKKILNDQVGTANGRPTVRIVDFKKQIQDKVPGYDMKMIAPAKAPDGKRYTFVKQFQMVNRGRGLYITTKAKNPADIIKWLDYQFTDEGANLVSYGKEGEHYTVVNGVPILKPEVSDAKMKPKVVVLGVMDWPAKAMPTPKNVRIPDLVVQWSGREDLYDQAVGIRKITEVSRVWPHSIQFPQTEMSIVSTKQSEIDSYLNEMYAKFLLGNESLENFDKFIGQLKKMGIDDLVDKNQQALNRYLKRK